MKITTLAYNANQPITKQITVPTGSEYAVGVKVYKDGEELSLGLGELTINDISAVAQSNGYNIFKLSSNSDEGMKMLDVVALKPPTLEAAISDEIYSTTFVTNRSM